MKYFVGQKYKRLNQMGVGSNQPMVFNYFEITTITTKYVHIFGVIASGLTKSRKINVQDFDNYLKNYNIL